jgi:hypothetical protein
MEPDFAKNLLARRWAGVVGFEHAGGDAKEIWIAALRVFNCLRVVDGRDDI